MEKVRPEFLTQLKEEGYTLEVITVPSGLYSRVNQDTANQFLKNIKWKSGERTYYLYSTYNRRCKGNQHAYSWHYWLSSTLANPKPSSTAFDYCSLCGRPDFDTSLTRYPTVGPYTVSDIICQYHFEESSHYRNVYSNYLEQDIFNDKEKYYFLSCYDSTLCGQNYYHEWLKKDVENHDYHCSLENQCAKCKYISKEKLIKTNTYSEVNQNLPEKITDSEQSKDNVISSEDMIQMLSKVGNKNPYLSEAEIDIRLNFASGEYQGYKFSGDVNNENIKTIKDVLQRIMANIE